MKPAYEVAQRDIIAAILRDAAPQSMTVTEIRGQVPHAHGWPCDGTCVERSFSEHWTCELGFHLYTRTGISGSVCTNLLNDLHRRGLVTRWKVGRRIHWTWAGESVDVSDLEEALASA